jgi:hypothetical protein
MGERHCPHCGEELDSAFLAADESLVALELEMTVFNVERDEHAARIARKEIGQRLTNIPLDVVEIEEVVEDDEDESDDDQTETDDSTAEKSESGDQDELPEDGDVLPEFEELIDE